MKTSCPGKPRAVQKLMKTALLSTAGSSGAGSVKSAPHKLGSFPRSLKAVFSPGRTPAIQKLKRQR